MKKIILSICCIFAIISVYTFFYGVEYKTWPETARIDISAKKINNEPCFEAKELETGKNISPTEWLEKWGKYGYIIEKNDKSETLELTIKKDNCKIDFSLRGPWEPKDKNNPQDGLKEKWVKYIRFAINGEDIIKEPVAAWHNKPINHTIVAQKGNVFYIKINWKKYIKPLSMVEKSIVWIICFVMLASVWLILFSDKKHLGLSLAVTVLLTMFSLNCIRENNLNVDFYAFVIIATAYFLVTYKLLKYLSRFKIEQHHSRIDIVFLVTFFILLFVPMLHISDAEKSEQENRMLAKYTPLIDYRGGGNLKYGKDFDAWFSDRFWGREKVIQWVNSVQYKISSVYSNNKALYLKKHGWMFVFPIVEIPFSEEKTKEINDNIQKFDAFLAEHGIKFYILIVPRKESIYQTELVDYSYDKQEDIKFQQSIQNIITANNTVPIIYPYDEMRKAKQKDYVFFKQSHHWTDWGAYQGYVKLMERIKKDFSDITVATLDKYEVSYSPKIRDEWKRNYHNGNTTYLLNLNTYADEILTTEYAYYDNKDNSSVKEIRGRYIKRFSNENGKYKIFLTGNSHNENLLQFLPYSAKEVKYLRLNNSQLPNKELYKFMKYYKKELLEFKPDIVIFSVSSDVLPRITDFFKD